jgi:hypothetical protein
MVTNPECEGLIDWQHERCGKSEAAHQVTKQDLAGEMLPSADFGENAAWWWIMTLTFNLNSALKRLKALRFSLIHLPGRVIAHARQLVMRFSLKSLAYEWVLPAPDQLPAMSAAAQRLDKLTATSQHWIQPSTNPGESCRNNPVPIRLSSI